MEYKNKLQKQIEDYLSDFDNLIGCSQIGSNDAIVTDYVYHHKGMTTKDFLLKGREFIRILAMTNKTQGDAVTKAHKIYSPNPLED